MKRLIATLVTFGFLALAVPAVYAEDAPKEDKAKKEDGKDKKAKAREVGKAIGAKLLAKQVSTVVFDRNGYLYHGRVAQVADGAREAGLAF